jgi:hypothetical protein
MSAFVSPNHPVQRLVFFAAQDVDKETKAAFESLVDEIRTLREWIIGPPRKVTDQNDENLVGGCLEIYSAKPPNKLSKEVDKHHLEEVESLVDVLKRFSFEHMLAIEFELDGEFVGALEDGEMDRSLREGLLGEWKRQLDAN